MNHTDFKPFIQQLCEASATVIKPWYFNLDVEIDIKSDDSPVTIADRRAEEALRDLIKKTYPSHGIIGEEFGEENTGADYVWELDPIDGTKTFISGCPLFGTLICLLYQGRPVLGAVNLPALNQLFIGDGQETTVNGSTVKMRTMDNLFQATLLGTDIMHFKEFQPASDVNKLIESVKLFRTWGDCYGYTLLAAGWADIMLDPIMNPWDINPLIPIIEGAGGKITDWHGGEVVNGESCIAANKVLHPLVVEILNSSK